MLCRSSRWPMPATRRCACASNRHAPEAGASPTWPACRAAAPARGSRPWISATRSPPATPPTTASPSTPTATPPGPWSSRAPAPAPRSPPPRSSTTPWPCRSDARVAKSPPPRTTVNGSRRERRSYRGSAFDDVYRQAAERGLLVLLAHVEAGVAHGLDYLVVAELVLAVDTRCTAWRD